MTRCVLLREKKWKKFNFLLASIYFCAYTRILALWNEAGKESTIKVVACGKGWDEEKK